MGGEPAKKITTEAPTALPEAGTEKPEQELSQAPEVQKLTEGTKEKALRVIEGGKGAETKEIKPTPEIEQVQKETAQKALETAGAAPASVPITSASAPEQPAPQEKGFFGFFKKIWRFTKSLPVISLFFGPKKSE